MGVLLHPPRRFACPEEHREDHPARGYIIFGDALTAFEKANHIVRGQPGSEASAILGRQLNFTTSEG
jgi:hypothetical protein